MKAALKKRLTELNKQGHNLPKGWELKSDEDAQAMIDAIESGAVFEQEKSETQEDSKENPESNDKKEVSVIETNESLKEEKKDDKEHITENQMIQENRSFKEKLLAEPKRAIFIQPNQMYKKGDIMPIAINGVTFGVPVGVRFTKENGVPESIYQVWEESYMDTMEANAKAEEILTREIELL